MYRYRVGLEYNSNGKIYRGESFVESIEEVPKLVENITGWFKDHVIISITITEIDHE